MAWIGVIVGTITETIREKGGNRIDQSSLAKSRTATIQTETDYIPDDELDNKSECEL